MTQLFDNQRTSPTMLMAYCKRWYKFEKHSPLRVYVLWPRTHLQPYWCNQEVWDLAPSVDLLNRCMTILCPLRKGNSLTELMTQRSQKSGKDGVTLVVTLCSALSSGHLGATCPPGLASAGQCKRTPLLFLGFARTKSPTFMAKARQNSKFWAMSQWPTT